MAPERFSNFNFEVILSYGSEASILNLAQRASFSQVSGLEINVASVELVEGGYNRGVRRLVGKATNPPLVLKRGLTDDRGFWDWIQACFTGTYPVPYVTGEVWVYPPFPDPFSQTIAKWRFTNGMATKVKAPDLNAVSAAIPIEELTIAHEGLERIQ